MPLVVQADEYFLHQIFSLMRALSCTNQTWRERSTQRRRNFLEHAFIDGSFAAPLGPHGLCPALLTLFHGHSSALAASIPPIRLLRPNLRSRPRETVAKAPFRPKDALKRMASVRTGELR
jgi:hypothetical protein